MLADSGRHNLFAIAVIGLAFAPLRSTAGAIIYVDAGATGADTGANWTDAFSDLQDALVAATAGDELWVAAGVYTPSDTDATASFIMTSGVAVYGGFNGTEASRHQRDWFTNVTTLSGDIGGDDVVPPGPRAGTSTRRTSGTSSSRVASTDPRYSTVSPSRTATPARSARLPDMS